MKFGGTSVGSAERMRVAARIAAGEREKRPVAVVVSAMSKITDLLLDTMRYAEAGDRAGMVANLAALRSRHEEACRELLPEARQAARAGQRCTSSSANSSASSTAWRCSASGRRARWMRPWPWANGSRRCWFPNT